jgi:hypothetical protein
VFFGRFLDKIGLSTAWLRGLVVGLMTLGLLATLYCRRWKAALFTILWLAIPFLILSVMKSPRPFVERYVIFVPPVALMLAGKGVVTLGQVGGSLVGQWDRTGSTRRARVVHWAVIAVLTAGLALLMATPLRALYAANRAADRIDRTLEVVERHAQPGDIIIISPRFFVRPLNANGAEVLYLTAHLSHSEFEDLLSRYQRAWILYTSYLPPVELQEALDQWIQARPDDFVRVPIKAITALAYHNQVLTEPEALLKDRIPVLEALARVSTGKQEAWLRYDILATTYESLAKLYADRGESSLAEEYRGRARDARATAPPP